MGTVQDDTKATMFCEHGATRNTPMRVDLWNGPIARCGCCGTFFGYINTGSVGPDGCHSRTWVPDDRCGSCGGKYVEDGVRAAAELGKGMA